MSKPAFDVGISSQEQPIVAPGVPAATASTSHRSPGHAPPPAARQLPSVKPLPKSDTALYVGLGVVALLIVGLLVALVVGMLTGGFDSDDPSDHDTELVDE